MAWQRATPDGGPEVPQTWSVQGEQAPYADLDTRIAAGLRQRDAHSRHLDQLRAADAEVADLARAVREGSARLGRALFGSPLDLPRSLASAAFLLAGRRPPFAPTRRSQERERLAARQEALAEAMQRRERLRRDLPALAGAQHDLVRAAQQKARRIIADRREGWQAVEAALEAQEQAGVTDFERLDEVRSLLRETRAMAWQIQDAIYRHDARIDGLIDRLRTQVERLQRELDSLGPGAPTLSPVPAGPARTLPWLSQPRAIWARGVVQDVLDDVDRVYREEELATSALADRSTQAADTLIDLMRRPF